MENEDLSARGFGAAFKGFLEQAATGVPVEEPVFAQRIREHLGTDPATLEIVNRSFDALDRPNVQVALDAYLEGEGRSAEILGFNAPYGGFHATSITQLIAQASPSLFGERGVQPGPVEYVDVDLGAGKTLSCLGEALLLVATENGPLVMLVSSGEDRGMGPAKIELQAMAAERGLADRFLVELRAEVRRRNVYRGRVMSLEQNHFGPVFTSTDCARQGGISAAASSCTALPGRARR
jgi:hypothetical protein